MGPDGRRDAESRGDRPGHRIELRRLRVTGTHGVLEEERTRAQPFEVDVDADCETIGSASTDDLADAVDYGVLVDAARTVVAGPPSARLLETLVDAVADAVLRADHRIWRVRVVVRKLRPPVAADLGTAGVAAVRYRDAARGVRAFLGLGSNMGDRLGHLRTAVGALRETGEVVAVSPLYRTTPVGGPDGQEDYLNVVVELRTGSTPRQLLERAHDLERAAGRVRSERFGPRTLDVDVLWVEGASLVQADLVVPHPRLWQRRFVLAPLRDVAPEMVPAEVLAASGGDVTQVGSLGA